jgi:hypothetical protein
VHRCFKERKPIIRDDDNDIDGSDDDHDIDGGDDNDYDIGGGGRGDKVILW